MNPKKLKIGAVRPSAARAIVTQLIVVAVCACSANSGPGVSSTTSIPAKADLPAVSLAVGPAAIKEGESAKAVWSTSNATACTATGAWSGSRALSNTAGLGIGPIQKSGTYTYGLTCTGPGGSTGVSQVLTVGTVPAPSIQFLLIPSAVEPGDSATIVWSSTNATSCVGTGGTGSDAWAHTQPTADISGFSTGPLSAAGQYTYSLSCSGLGGEAQVSRILTVSTASPPAPPTVSFAAQSTFLQTGQSTTFNWTTTNAASCSASGGSGSDGWSGSQATASTGTSIGPLNTAGNYSYTLSCAGAGGSASKSIDISVSSGAQPTPPVSVTVDITPQQIAAGGAAALTWSTANAASCAASGSWSGAEPLLGSGVSTGTLTTPAVYSYTLTCTGPGGSAVGTASLTVNPAAPVIAAFSATPAIQTGQSVALTWSSTGATSCLAGGGTGSDGWAGTVATSSAGTNAGPINTLGTYVYTLTCSGVGGSSAPRSATVIVTSPSPLPASITAFTATPSTIQVGQSASLAWSSTGADACSASGGTGSAWTGSVGVASTGTSTGPINTAGSYTFTLTCTGPGGPGAPNSAIVNVNSVPAMASIIAFTATPSTLSAGQSASLSWSTNGATSCTAGGGTGSDGWGGTVGTSSTGTSTGAINSAGSYIYTLTCTGPGGASAPSAVVVNVNTAPPPLASITTFNATPSTLQSGQSTDIVWSTLNATSCTALGGTGSDGWSGSVGTSSTGTPIGPIGVAGSYTYTLTCTGPGGSSAPSLLSVDVNAAPLPALILTFTAMPETVQVGQSITLAWATSGATSCTASGGTGSDGWAGSNVAVSNSGDSVGPLNAAGSYTYTLTCTGSGGASAPSSVTVNVNSAPAAATISSLTATPGALQTGGSTLLAWTSANADACAATGGSGSGWSGLVATSSTGISVGPINTAGSYIYTLTCTGPGGTSAPSSATVIVTATAPPASITSFTAAPSTLITGQSAVLAWTTNAASACTASGGTGSDGWPGIVGIASAGTTVGPINATGNYTYTLVCSGPGGASPPSSLSVAVNSAPPAASIVSFTATPSTVPAGQSTTLAWSSSNATSCAATGGSGSDGWGGTVGGSSAGTSVGPLTTAGPLTYTLTCTGPGGAGAPSAANVTVTAVVPAAPTVALAINGANVAEIQPGQSPRLTWTSSHATSCTASGGTGSDGWSGAQPTTSSGAAVGPIATPGIYSYTLTCTGPGGSGGSTVQLTVISSSSADCGISGSPATLLLAPAASASSAVNGLCLIGCGVNDLGNLIDSTATNYATMSVDLGVAATVSLEVTDNTTVYPSGRTVGFLMANSSPSLLNASLLQNISVVTLLNGNVRESATIGSTLTLQALGLLPYDPDAGYVAFTTTKSFDSVRMNVSSLVSALSSFHVYGACVSLH